MTRIAVYCYLSEDPLKKTPLMAARWSAGQVRRAVHFRPAIIEV